MDDLVAPLGISLPEEARTWWGWHDGVEETALQHTIGPHWAFGSLSQAVEDTLMMREVAADPDLAGENIWRDSYLCVALGEAYIVGDTSVGRDQPMPIRLVDTNDQRYPEDPDLPSLGALIRAWTESIRTARWTFDPGSGYWDADDAADFMTGIT